MKKRLAAGIAACVLCIGLSACGNAAGTYTEYVNSVMECTYQGNSDAYRRLTKSSDADAQAVRQDEIRYVHEQLCHQASVDSSALSAETAAGFDALAENLLGKVQYSTEDAVRAGKRYQITITASPLDLFTLAIPDMESAYRSDFSKKFYEVSDGSDAKTALEAEWGARALEIYNSHLEEVGYLDPQSVTVYVTLDADKHYSVSAKEWQKVDALLFGLAKAE